MFDFYKTTRNPLGQIKGVVSAKMVFFLSIFCFLLEKSLQVWGHHIPNFKGASGTRTPSQNGGQRKGSFFSFSIENEKEKGKNILYIL